MEIITSISNIVENVRRIRQDRSFSLLAMVKANAYNHGIREVTRALSGIVDGFGVFSVFEGTVLRREGVELPILVTGPFVGDELTAARYRLTLTVGDVFSLKRLLRFPQRFSVYIKLNTGMSRFGFSEGESEFAAKAVYSSKNIELTGVSTHFSKNSREELCLQRERFLAAAKPFGEVKLSAGATSYLKMAKELSFSELRIGLALYGYGADGIELLPAMRVTSELLAVRNIRAGEEVGYGGLYKPEKNVKIGIIRGGYYDGIPAASSGRPVIVNGCETRLVGNGCMDTSFVDLDGINAKIGDKVELLGEGLDAERLSAYCERSAYEILTSFRGRYKRRFE